MKEARYFYGWNIVAAAILIGFFTTGLAGYSNGILLPYLADELAEGSRGQISLAFSAGTVCAALSAPFIGRYADKHSPRRVMLVGAVLLTLVYVGTASATELWHLFISKGILYGLAAGMAGPMVRSKIVAQWFDKIRGRALGFSVMGASIAGVTLPLILSTMVLEYGWRTTMYALAMIVALVLLPTIGFIMRDKPEDMGLRPDGSEATEEIGSEISEAQEADDQQTPSWKEMLQSRALWSAGLTFGPMICVYIVIMVHLFGHMLGTGLSETEAALVLSVLATTSIFGKPLVGVMADAIGARVTMWFSLLLQAVALASFAYAESVFQFSAAAVIHGLGYAAFSSMRTFSLAEAFGVRSLGTAVGLLSWIELPFAALASPIAGFVYDATGSYDSAFLVFSGFLVFGCVGPLLFRSKKKAALTAATL